VVTSNDEAIVAFPGIDPTLAVQMLLTEASYLKVEAEVALTIYDADDCQLAGARRDLSPFGR
jgi:hypothetical protein